MSSPSAAPPIWSVGAQKKPLPEKPCLQAQVNDPSRVSVQIALGLQVAALVAQTSVHVTVTVAESLQSPSDAVTVMGTWPPCVHEKRGVSAVASSKVPEGALHR